MNTNLTQQMPSEVAAIYRELFQDMCQLQLNWNLYRDLFANSPQRIQLLNKTIPDVAGLLQRTLQDIVYLGLTRITDPSESCGRPNMTLYRLVQASRGQMDAASLQALEQAVAVAKAACEVCRKHRDKRIAHSDADWAMRSSFTRPSREYVEEALDACQKALNLAHTHFEGTGPVMYEAVSHPRGGGQALIVHLEWAERFRELRQSAIRGDLTFDSVLSELIHRP